MPSNLAYYSGRRRQPPYRYGRRPRGRRVFFDNNVVMSPAALGSRGRMPITTSIGNRRRLAPTPMSLVPYHSTQGDQGHARSTKRSRYSRTEPDQPQSTRQHGDLDNDRDDTDDRASLKAPPLRTLKVQALKWPVQGTDVGQRLGTTIRVSGFKVCEQFTNTQAYPIVVHYAILQQKNESGNIASAVGSDSTGLTSFFRNNLGGSSRSRDFTNAVADLSIPFEFFYDCFGINPDQYHVLTHKRMVLAAENTDVKWNWDTWKFDDYIDLKGKRFTFALATDTQPQSPIYRVFWWQPLREADWADPVPNPLPAIQRNNHSAVYFTNAMS